MSSIVVGKKTEHGEWVEVVRAKLADDAIAVIPALAETGRYVALELRDEDTADAALHSWKSGRGPAD